MHSDVSIKPIHVIPTLAPRKTDIREYVDAMTNSELLDMLLGSDWDEER